MSVSVTLTLDDEVLARLREEATRSGRSLDATANELLKTRPAESVGAPAQPFRVRSRPLGLRPGLDVDCVSALLDEIEGPGRS